MTHITVATRAHIAGVLALQADNLLAVIAPEDQADGFVTTPFTANQLEGLIVEKSLFVALEDKQVIAYIVSASWHYLSAWPIFVHMVSLFPEFTYRGEEMTIDNSYQYGPVCVSADYRGTDLLLRIFTFAREAMAVRYDYALTFVNKRNERSYQAHKRKLLLDKICEFSFAGQEFHMFAFSTKKLNGMSPNHCRLDG